MHRSLIVHAPIARRLAVGLIALIVGGALAACGGGQRGWDSRSVQESIKDAPFTPILVNSNVGIGRTRLLVALFKDDQSLEGEATVSGSLYRLDKAPEGEPTNPREAATLTFTARGIDTGGATREFGIPATLLVSADPAGVTADTTDRHEGHVTTMYSAVTDLDAAGTWGLSLQVAVGKKTYRDLRFTFIVQPRTAEPAVGDLAPKSRQKILADVRDIAEIDSALTPNPEMHRLTVEQAVTSGKPSVIAFVTPAYCTSRFCGPVLEQAITPAWQQYRDRVHFLHVEPYDVPTARTSGKLDPVPAALEWKLLAEPAVFVVDAQGRVAAKFEGVLDVAELREALNAVLK